METLKSLRDSYSNIILAYILEGKFKILSSNDNGCLLLIDDCIELNMCFFKRHKRALPVIVGFTNGRDLLRVFTEEEEKEMFIALEKEMYEVELRRLTSQRSIIDEEIEKLKKTKNE